MGLNRRHFLSGAAALLAAPRVAFAGAGGERRFVFIIQRGAADGLGTVIPYAEPAYAGLRGALAIDPQAALKLDAMFALHPALAGIGELYRARQASFFHAVASPYRDRSHFDGQNVLETGGAAPFAAEGRLDEPAGRHAAARRRRRGDRVCADACRWRCAAASRWLPMRRPPGPAERRPAAARRAAVCRGCAAACAVVGGARRAPHGRGCSVAAASARTPPNSGAWRPASWRAPTARASP